MSSSRGQERRLHRKLNAQLQFLVANAAGRIRPGIQRLAVVWQACKTMFDHAATEEERKFWREYLIKLEVKSDQIKKAQEERERRLMS